MHVLCKMTQTIRWSFYCMQNWEIQTWREYKTEKIPPLSCSIFIKKNTSVKQNWCFVHQDKNIFVQYIWKKTVLKVGPSQSVEEIFHNVSNQSSGHHLIFWPNSRNLSSWCRHHPETGFYYFLLSHHRVQLDHKAYLQWSIIVVTKVICSTLFCYSCCESQTSLEEKNIFFRALCWKVIPVMWYDGPSVW